MKVVVVSVHPDDFCLCIGGTVALHSRSGDSVKILVLSDGERGGDPDVRKKEARVSASILGTEEPMFLGIPDGHVDDSIETVSMIEDYIKDDRPDRIYCCSHKDRHQDHRYASLATISASRMIGNIFLYEGMSAWTSFEPTTFIDISEVIEVKMESIAAHRSQEDRYYMRPDSVMGQNQFRGWQAHMKYAEAFEIARQVLSI
jgi:LmbE family N-acetylglucosaminyl deacetylase